MGVVEMSDPKELFSIGFGVRTPVGAVVMDYAGGRWRCEAPLSLFSRSGGGALF